MGCSRNNYKASLQDRDLSNQLHHYEVQGHHKFSSLLLVGDHMLRRKMTIPSTSTNYHLLQQKNNVQKLK